MPTYTDRNGRRWNACSCLVEWLPVFEHELLDLGVIKRNIDVAQLIGGAAASGGTHSRGGAADVWQTQRKAVQVARYMGAAAWARTRSQGFDPHSHIVLNDCPHNTPARYQIVALEAGYNGLGRGGRGGRDDGPRDMPIPLQSYKQGIAWAKARQARRRKATAPAKPKPPTKSTRFRVGTLNIPLDPAKLPDGRARVKHAAKAIHAANLHVLACQELDRGYKGDTWYYARLMLLALREHDPSWRIVKPTTAWNENITFYRTRKATLKRRLSDVILTSSAGGRHASRSTYTIDGETVAVRNTHLVSGSRNGAAREKQAEQIADVSGASTIILGDLNQKALPKALAKTHKTARDHALATTNAEYGTHTRWGATKASTDDDSFLDHIVVPERATVRGYTVVGIDDDGNLVEPRISDHQLTIASIEFPAA